MRPARVPACEIDVSDDEIAAKLRAYGYACDPRTAPPALRACARAEIRAEKDKGRWALEPPVAAAPSFTTRQAQWKPPPKLRIATVSGRDRATGDCE